MRQRVALGVRCVSGQPRAAGVLFGAAGAGAWSVRAVAFGDAGGSRFGLVGLGRLPRAAGGMGCLRAGGPFEHAERSVISGGICACHAATWLPFGVRCVSGQLRAAGVCSGLQGSGRGSSGRWRLGVSGAAGLAWRDWIVCPERRAGLLASWSMVRSEMPGIVWFVDWLGG